MGEQNADLSNRLGNRHEPTKCAMSVGIEGLSGGTNNNNVDRWEVDRDRVRAGTTEAIPLFRLLLPLFSFFLIPGVGIDRNQRHRLDSFK